jgi:hypothetical protein
MTCQSCEKLKEKLNIVRSSLVPSLDLKICHTCKYDEMEPRWVVVLAARSGKSPDKVVECVKSRRYLGDEIKLAEILA